MSDKLEQFLNSLAPRQLQVAQGFMAGLTQAEIARELGTAPQNVFAHKCALRRKWLQLVSIEDLVEAHGDAAMVIRLRKQLIK